MTDLESTAEPIIPIVVAGTYRMTLEGHLDEAAAIALIKAIIERLSDYEVRQRVLAWTAQFAEQHGVD